MSLSLASCLTAPDSPGSVLLGGCFARLRAPTYNTYAGLGGLFLDCSCSGNGGLNTSHDVSLGDELRTGRKVQTSGQGLQLRGAEIF